MEKEFMKVEIIEENPETHKVKLQYADGTITGWVTLDFIQDETEDTLEQFYTNEEFEEYLSGFSELEQKRLRKLFKRHTHYGTGKEGFAVTVGLNPNLRLGASQEDL